MKIEIDHDVYSDNIISKVAYWLSGCFDVERHLEGTIEIMSISSINGAKINETQLRSDIFQMLNDQKLRNIIEEETKDIRTILYAKAFADCDDLTEEDLTE